MISIQKKERFYWGLSRILTVLIYFIFRSIFIVPNHVLVTNKTVYEDGIYGYTITNEPKQEVRLVGIETNQVVKEPRIPSNIIVNQVDYKLTHTEIEKKY